MSACGVKWCTGTGSGTHCPIHTKRPALPGEDRDTWEKRIRREDRAARLAAIKAAEQDAHVKKRLGT